VKGKVMQQLSKQAQEALRRIRALRKLPKSESTIRAEQKVLDHLPLKDVAEVALALDEEASV
jgi:hypothetical protein